MIVGIVLAAGRSSRMGSPKALLTFRGEPFLGRVIGAMRGGGCEAMIVVTGPPGNPDAARIANLAISLGAEAVVNPEAESEQVDSLRLAIAALPEDAAAVVVSPVDSPDCPPEVIARLVAEVSAGSALAIPEYGGRRGHPVVIARRVLPELRDGELPEGLRTVIRRHEVELAVVTCDTASVLLDVDTPEDFRRLSAERR